jgi:[ribosomal protein S5]-alanine N-acetyltransferase
MIQRDEVGITGRAAVAIVTNPDGEVLLQLRDDIPGIAHPGRWGFPGGALEPGEDPDNAVRRELLEQTGIKAGQARRLFDLADEVEAGGSGHLIHAFHVQHDGPASELVLGEGQRLRFFPLRALPDNVPPHVREAIDIFLADRRDGPSRVTLRPITSGDQAEFLQLARASTDLHHPMRLPTTAEEFQTLIARYDQPAEECLLVCVRDTGAIAGIVNINSIIRGRFQCGSIAYAAFAPTAGQGYMSEGLELVLRYAFEDLRLHRLEAQIQPDNKASLKLVQRHGFRKEGYSPDLLFIDGAWRDHERWAITAQMTNTRPTPPHPTQPTR